MRLVNYFVPPKAASSVEELRSSRILVKFLLITGLINLLYIANALSIGFWPMEYVLLLHGLSSFAIAALFRGGLPRIACANLSVVIGFASVFIAVWYGGGIESPSTIGVMLLPVTALLLAGRKSGIFWLVVSVAALFSVYAYETNVANLPVTYNVSNTLRNLCNSLAGIMVFLFLITLVFDIEKTNAVNSVVQANEILKTTQSEIVGQRDQLTATLAELQAVQTQLIQSEKMASLGELTAGIAHEIQNPLNFINNFADINADLAQELMAEKATITPEEERDLLADIAANAQKISYHGRRADAIVKGMLQHSSGGIGQKEPTDINALCDEFLRLSYHGMRAKEPGFNAALQTDFDNSAGKLSVVPQDIGRVLLNLFNNAFYALHQKSRSLAQTVAGAGSYKPCVTVHTKKENDALAIFVKDNGIGIPQAVIDKVFQPFFTTKPTGEGTGLGLSLTYDIIKAHGGELKVASEEGAYTLFIIKLPYT